MGSVSRRLRKSLKKNWFGGIRYEAATAQFMGEAWAKGMVRKIAAIATANSIERVVVEGVKIAEEDLDG